jgi:hypothetical protein
VGRRRRPPTTRAWLLVLLASLMVSTAILWDVWPLLASVASGLRPRALPAPAPVAGPPAQRRVRLVVAGPDGQLSEREHAVPRQPLMADEVRAVLAALQRAAETPPGRARVGRVYLDSYGILYLDFGPELREWLEASGPAAEAAVRAVAATLTRSFEAVRRVQLLVGGEELPMAVGGVDLRRPVVPAGEQPDPTDAPPATRGPAPQEAR